MTSNFAQGLLSTWLWRSASPLKLKVYKACLCVMPTGYILYTLSSFPPLIISGLSCFQIGTCFKELNFESTADSKACRVIFPDLPIKVQNKIFTTSETERKTSGNPVVAWRWIIICNNVVPYLKIQSITSLHGEERDKTIRVIQQIFLLYQFKQMWALWLQTKQLSFWWKKMPILAKIGLYYIMKKKKRWGISVMKSNEPTLKKWTSTQMPLFLLHKHDARFLSHWCTCRDVSWTLGSFLPSLESLLPGECTGGMMSVLLPYPQALWKNQMGPHTST